VVSHYSFVSLYALFFFRPTRSRRAVGPGFRTAVFDHCPDFFARKVALCLSAFFFWIDPPTICPVFFPSSHGRGLRIALDISRRFGSIPLRRWVSAFSRELSFFRLSSPCGTPLFAVQLREIRPFSHLVPICGSALCPSRLTPFSPQIFSSSRSFPVPFAPGRISKRPAWIPPCRFVVYLVGIALGGVASFALPLPCFLWTPFSNPCRVWPRAGSPCPYFLLGPGAPLSGGLAFCGLVIFSADASVVVSVR